MPAMAPMVCHEFESPCVSVFEALLRSCNTSGFLCQLLSLAAICEPSPRNRQKKLYCSESVMDLKKNHDCLFTSELNSVIILSFVALE